VRLYARMGSFVFPNVPLAGIAPAHPDAEKMVRSALALGPFPTSSGDMEYNVTQLSDIALRALSPGINDPNTALRVVDRLGAALCIISRRHLATGRGIRDGREVLARETITARARSATPRTRKLSAAGTRSSCVPWRLQEARQRYAMPLGDRDLAPEHPFDEVPRKTE
jgi:uncharacterized membrane protein